MSIGKDAARPFRGFRMVPDRLWLDPRLKDTDVRLWCALEFASRGRDFTDATDDALAGMISASPATVRRSLLRLEECRFLARERQGEGRIITLNAEGDGMEVAGMELRVVGE